MDGRKIISELENPIDNILIILSIKFGDILHKYKFITPNIITTISIILSIIAIYFIYIKYYKIGAILFFISYFFDCLDGNFARRFNMVTTFGDYYDHIGDIFKYLLLIYVILISNLKNITKYIFIILIIICGFLSLIHLGCQEKIYNNKSVLKILKIICLKRFDINYTKYFGSGTTIFIIFIYLFFIKELNMYFKN
jgi:phosphatidylglycerophosphate synthase